MRSLLFLLLASSSAAQRPVVEVFLPPTPETVRLALVHAEIVVTEIYRDIGIQVQWRATTRRPSGCEATGGHAQIVVAVAATPPKGLSREALAYSTPSETIGPCVALLLDRFAETLRMNPKSGGSLLGHVLAHEMGHILQGVSRHSYEGVMKARWSLHDTRVMAFQRMRFSDEDRDLILNVLSKSQARRPDRVNPSFIETPWF